MKKLTLLFFVFIFAFSCSKEDDFYPITFEAIKTVSVDIPDSFNLNEEGIIKVRYNRPTTCHGFDGFVWQKENLTRTVFVRNFVVQKEGCSPLTNELREEIIRFKPVETGTYTFKFWTGKDTNGNNTFLEFQRDVL
jgi:hypothetical protein